MELLREKGMTDVTVLIGGIIPEADIPALKKAGIAEVFSAGNDDAGDCGFHSRPDSGYASYCLVLQSSLYSGPSAAKAAVVA